MKPLPLRREELFIQYTTRFAASSLPSQQMCGLSLPSSLMFLFSLVCVCVCV